LKHLLPYASDSLLTNGDFESELSGWSNISSAGGNAETIPGGAGSVLRLTPSAEGTAALLQQVAVDPSTSYRLSFSLTSAGGSYGYAGVRGHAGKWSEISVGDNASGRQTLDFVTDAKMCLKSPSFFRHIVNKQHRSSLTTFVWSLATARRHQNLSIHHQQTQLRQMYRRQMTPPDTTPPEDLPPRVDGNFVRNADFSTLETSLAGSLQGLQVQQHSTKAF